MTTRAFRPQLLLMFVLVTGKTSRGKAEKSMGRVLYLKSAKFLLRDIIRLVASFTRQAGVLSLQRITRLTVSERLPSQGPLNDFKGLSGVLGMTPHAVLPLIRFLNHAGVVATSCGKPVPDFHMTVQTLKPGASTTDAVAGGAFCKGIQGSMSL